MAVYQLMEDWGIKERFKMMCFDTTASNTGIYNDACVLLEQQFRKDFLNIACCHVYELRVAAVFNILMAPSSGPTIKFVQRFVEKWSTIDKNVYEGDMCNPDICARLELK